MKTKIHVQRKITKNSACIPVQNALASCGFNTQPQAETTLPQDLETAAQFGHHLSNVSLFATGTQSSGLPIQPKLTIGKPRDKYEQEADRVAAEVVSRINAPLTPPVQRQSGAKEDEQLQMKPVVQRLATGESMAATPDLENAIQSSRGSGQPLADSIRQPMEQAFGANFEGVRVHTGTQSDQMNQSIQAKAFTTGKDIFFRQGEYNPGNRGGQELIAHELTHVVQQRGEGGRTKVEAKKVSTIQRQIYIAGKSKTAQNIQILIQQKKITDKPTLDVINSWLLDNEEHNFDSAADLIQRAGDEAQQRENLQQQLEKLRNQNPEQQNTYVASLIQLGVPAQVDYSNVKSWADEYFSGVEYQNNKTNGWHENRHSCLPGEPTAEGQPTRYVEFRRPGAWGEKDKSKLERCIFDLIDLRCWPNAHYDGGYVEIINVPQAVIKNMFEMAWSSTGMEELFQNAKKEGNKPELVGKTKAHRQALLQALATDWENTREK